MSREKREMMLVFRQRHYEPREFAFLMGFLRSRLPWFCNSNGPRKRVLWGNPAPFPVVNIIRGNWITDVYRLKTQGAHAALRPPIPKGRYFTDAGYQARTGGPAGWKSCLLFTHIFAFGCAAQRGACSSWIAASSSPPSWSGCEPRGSRTSRSLRFFRARARIRWLGPTKPNSLQSSIDT
jgi:hypothetical protein